MPNPYQHTDCPHCGGNPRSCGGFDSCQDRPCPELAPLDEPQQLMDGEVRLAEIFRRIDADEGGRK
jgi:hypothetical protein